MKLHQKKKVKFNESLEAMVPVWVSLVSSSAHLEIHRLAHTMPTLALLALRVSRP